VCRGSMDVHAARSLLEQGECYGAVSHIPSRFPAHMPLCWLVGARVTKYGRRGRPKQRFIFLQDGAMRWSDKKGKRVHKRSGASRELSMGCLRASCADSAPCCPCCCSPCWPWYKSASRHELQSIQALREVSPSPVRSVLVNPRTRPLAGCDDGHICTG